jgi:hypothetical protein
LREELSREAVDKNTPWVLDAETEEMVRKKFADSRRELAAAGVEGDPGAWAEFAALARELLAAGAVDLDADERAYKVAMADAIRDVRVSVEEDRPGWHADLSRALGKGGNLLFHITRGKYAQVVASDPAAAREQLLALWNSDGGAAAVQEFAADLKRRDSDIGPGDRVAIASNLLLPFADVAPYRARTAVRLMRRVQVEPHQGPEPATRWAQYLDLLDEANSWLADEGLDGDRLHAQNVMWVVSEYPIDELASGDLATRLRDWRGEAATFARANRIEPVCEDAGWRVLKSGMLQEASPLTGGPSVWNLENAQSIIARIWESPLIGGEASFEDKIRIQMDGGPADVIQLVAEFQLVRQLPTGGIRVRGATKSLAMYAELAEESWTLPDWLQDAVALDVFGGGNRFNQDQWLHLVLMAHAMVAWFQLEERERLRILGNPWDLVDFLETVGGSAAAEKHMRMVLGYLAWPNYFHPIISGKHINEIRGAFREVVGQGRGDKNADIQRDLYDIDQYLAARHGGPVNFYQSPFVEYWREGEPEVHVETAVNANFSSRAASLSGKVHMTSEALARIGRVLEDRHQVVFYGPPGTGKTFVARELAAVLAGADAGEVSRLVQFHPSYAYEDFFEGFRPDPEGGAGFTLQPGPLRKVASSAADNPDQPHFLIIDEMNRGNLAKVFGELYFLLEYREESVLLQYSPTKPFKLPDNLFIIGTMNTADRSIGLVDAAIRRRFAFIEFHPETSPVEGVLERFLAAERQPSDLSRILGRLNSLIGDRDLRVGPSYFMKRRAFDEQGLADIWEYDILPLLYEHFHGRKSVEEVRREFDLDAMRSGAGEESQA